MVTEAVILAGGLGTRLRSAVADLPKAMAPIAGRPFLTYLLQFLEMNGMRRVVLAVGYRKEAISNFLGSTYGNLKLLYSVEEEPLGTGGALLQSLAYVDGPSLVLNGDTFLRLNYRAMAAAFDDQPADSMPDPRLLVALRPVADAGRYGAALVAGGRIQGFTARGTPGPGLINAGSYLIDRDVFQRYPMPRKFSFEEDFLQARSAEVRPLAFECEAPFIDIGVPEALQEAQTLIPEWINAIA